MRSHPWIPVLLLAASLGALGWLQLPGPADPEAGTEEARRAEKATYCAAHLVSQIRSRPLASRRPLPEGLDDADDARRELNAEPLGGLGPDPGLRRNIQVRRGTGQRSSLLRIQVKVFWRESGQEKSVELVAYQRCRADLERRPGGGPRWEPIRERGR